jgi:hypothetical protein
MVIASAGSDVLAAVAYYAQRVMSTGQDIGVNNFVTGLGRGDGTYLRPQSERMAFKCGSAELPGTVCSTSPCGTDSTTYNFVGVCSDTRVGIPS